MGQLAQRAQAIAPAQNKSIQFVDDAGNAIVVTQQDVMQFICDKATPQEVVFFMEMCRAQRLNPFLREAFLVKYGNGPASMITAEVVFERRANGHPDYRGMECGVVYTDRNGEIGKRAGTATYKALGETLIGGWATVYRDDRVDAYAEVSVDEYNKGQSVWKQMPGVMIVKCAKGVALRQAFPTDFQGMYLQEEVGVAPTIEEAHAEVVEERPSGRPTEEEGAELREMTDRCAALGYDPSATARRLFECWKDGGIEEARAAAAEMMDAADAVADVTEA